MRHLLPVILLAALPVWAQQGNPQPLPAVPPPPPGMEAFDAALEPQVTIVKTETETREEYRQNGKLRMIRIRPRNGPEQIYFDQNSDGRLDRDPLDGPVAPVYFTIYEWN